MGLGLGSMIGGHGLGAGEGDGDIFVRRRSKGE